MFDDLKITLTQPELFAAVAPCASKEKAHYYLCGVHICRAAAGGLYLVATDGHRMAVGYDEHATMEGDDECVIVGTPTPAELKMFTAKTTQAAVITKTRADFGSISDDGFMEPCSAFLPGFIDGIYPDWGRLVPTETYNPPVDAFNAGYLAAFERCGKALGKQRVHVKTRQGSPGGPALVTIGVSNWFGVLMPARAEWEDTVPPFAIHREG